MTHLELGKLMRRAFNLGQNYWQQADSDSYSQNKKSEATLATFNALVEEACSALALAASESKEQRSTLMNKDPCSTLRIKAQAVVDRWETPLWKDVPATAKFIYELRDALEDHPAGE